MPVGPLAHVRRGRLRWPVPLTSLDWPTHRRAPRTGRRAGGDIDRSAKEIRRFTFQEWRCTVFPMALIERRWGARIPGPGGDSVLSPFVSIGRGAGVNFNKP